MSIQTLANLAHFSREREKTKTKTKKQTLKNKIISWILNCVQVTSFPTKCYGNVKQFKTISCVLKELGYQVVCRLKYLLSKISGSKHCFTFKQISRQQTCYIHHNLNQNGYQKDAPFSRGCLLPPPTMCVFAHIWSGKRSQKARPRKDLENNGGCQWNPTICMTSKAKENSGCAIFKQIQALPYGFPGAYINPPETKGQL